MTTFLIPTWEQYQRLTQDLAATLLSETSGHDLIVAIARGGLTLGHLLSDYLRTPISVISIQSYTDLQKQGELKLNGKLTIPIKGKRILLVDDIADSGKTFLRALSYLHRLHPTSITTVALYAKPHTAYRPDFYSEETSKWIVMPHETTETIMSLTTSMKREGKSKIEIQEFLENLGYTLDQILFVRQFHLG